MKRVIYSDLKNFLQEKYKEIFDYYIEPSSTNNDFVSFINQTGEVIDDASSQSITFKFSIQAAYLNGQVVGVINGNDIWPTSLYKHFEIKITNLALPKETTIKEDVRNNGINANNGLESKAPYEVVEEDIQNFIATNINNIFNQPAQFNSNDVTNVNIQIVNSTTITVRFRCPIYLDDNVTTDEFSFNINNLTNKDTKIKNEIVSNGLSVKGSYLENYPVSNIKEVIGNDVPASNSDSVDLYNNLKNFLQEKYTEIFDYSVPANSGDTDFISFSNDKGEVLNSGEDSITFNFTVKSAYVDGKKIGEGNSNNNQWSPSLYKKFEIKLHGFAIINTELKTNTVIANGDIASKAPYEINNDDIASFISTNYSQLFNNPAKPTISSSEVESISFEIINSTEISVTATVPALVKNNLSKKEFRFTLSNLTNKDTKQIKDNVIADARLSTYTPTQIEMSIGQPKNEINTEVAEFIWNKRNEIFINIPPNSSEDFYRYVAVDSFQSNNHNYVAGSVVSKTGNSLTIKFSFKPVHINGQHELTDWQENVNIQNFELTINNLRDEVTTSIRNDVFSNGISALGTNIEHYAPYELIDKQNELKSFIVAKKNDIFENLVNTLEISDINIESVTPFSSNEIKIRITIPTQTNGIIDNPSRTFEIRIIQLTNKDTSQSNVSISATGKLAELFAVNVVDEGINGPDVNLIKEFISINTSNLFSNYPGNSIDVSSMTIMNITLENSSSINVSIDIDGCVKNGVLSPNNYSIIITNLRQSTDSNVTTLKLKHISYNDNNFKKIFADFSKFEIDWIYQKYSLLDLLPTVQLINYMNANTSLFFDNLPNSISDPVKKITLSALYNDTNSFVFNVTFDGYNETNIIVEHTATISLNLISTPFSFDDIVNESSLNNDFKKWMTDNNITWPTSDAEIANLVKQFINEKIDNMFVGIDIPIIFSSEQNVNVVVDVNKIQLNGKNIIIDKNAITIQSSISEVNEEIKNNNQILINYNQEIITSSNSSSLKWVSISMVIGIAFFIFLILIFILIARYKKRNELDKSINN